MNFTNLDKACMVEKALLLNGVIAYGNAAEKKWALQEWAKIKPLIEEAIQASSQQNDVHENENPLF